MKNRTPTRPAVPDFAPVPRKHVRHDGWTPERQKVFIEALTDTGSVTHAAHAANMTPESAYQLRGAEGAEDFAAAWAAALDHGIARLEDVDMERALNGIEVPVYCYGKPVGTRTVYNDQLLMFLLRNRAPNGRFSADLPLKRATPTPTPAAARKPWEADEEEEDEEAFCLRLRAQLEEIHQRMWAEGIGPYAPKETVDEGTAPIIDLLPRAPDAPAIPGETRNGGEGEGGGENGGESGGGQRAG